MRKSSKELWQRFKTYYREYPSLGLAIDISRMDFGSDFFQTMAPRMQSAFAAMAKLEQGAIANPDEGRMVGHYWLRNSALAPTPAIREEIESTIRSVKTFAAEVHSGRVRGFTGVFKNLLVIGIGGSALGPQFVSHALGNPTTDRLKVFFFDNTDPDGMDRILAGIRTELGHTICVVISKSGGTKETRNGMLEAETAYRQAGLDFAPHAVAITGTGSELDRYASDHHWLRRFPMWDWVGGRTSVTSAVGLLPAALQGIGIDDFLQGAGACDAVTRQTATEQNPAALLALMCFYIGKGRGAKDMVVLPYKDRLELFSRYLQQLVMESLGKEKDLAGNIVNQGLTVYGNKGSTDQHAYVQQLRDGLPNFFVTFIEVLRDRAGVSINVDPDVTSGDYLHGFLRGTRQALHENGRESVTLTLTYVSALTVGVLIALFERAIGLYATLINVNAYNQPGVEAGKKAADAIIQLQLRIVNYLRQKAGKPFTIAELAAQIGADDEMESVFKLCEHLAANDRGVRGNVAGDPLESTYEYVSK